MIASKTTENFKQAPPDDEACVGCEYAGGIVLHYCTHRQSEFFGGLVDFEGWCPQFIPRQKK